MSDVALSVLMLSIVAVIGLWLGGIKIKGVGLGIGGVLFGGLLVGHYLNQFGLSLDRNALHFIQEFGLILFVYTIGIQVGPGFFSSLKSSGLKLNALAAGIVLIGGLVAVALHFIFHLPLNIFLGIYSGAVTNTPSLAAGQQILKELGMSGDQTNMLGLGYAMAYPFGIIGILAAMWIVRIVLKINVDDEADRFARHNQTTQQAVQSLNVKITNPNLDGLRYEALSKLLGDQVIASRLKTVDGQVRVPMDDVTLQIGDILRLVAPTEDHLQQALLIVGEKLSEDSFSFEESVIKSNRVVVTNEKVLGKKLSELNIKYSEHVVITRLNRTGIELMADKDTILQFGDILTIVGTEQDLDHVGRRLGNVRSKLEHVQMLPVFIGIGLGALLGSLPFHLPHLPAPLKLGLAGGPLIVALILSRIGSIGRLYWFMPPSANHALREIGIVLFLAVVGLKSGANFMHTLVQGDGISWMCYGLIITLVPLLTIGFLGRIIFKVNYLSLCGLMAGSMTDPPALAFANAIHATSGASALAYATVYPLVMCLRILSPQIIAVLLWVAS